MFKHCRFVYLFAQLPAMANETTKKPWLRRLLISLLILVLIGAGIYWWVATDQFSDTKDRKAAYTLPAAQFLKEFQDSLAVANTRYTDQIVAISGRVSEVEAADTTINIKFVDPATSSYLIFAFQQQHLAEAKSVKVGDSLTVKGSCSGGIFSELLEVTSVSFKRSALVK